VTNPLERDALLSLLAGGRMEQSRGPMMRNPTPDWLKRENDSVFDSMPEKAAKALLRLLGADDPSGQVIGIAAPVEVPGGVASPLKRAADAVGGAVKKGIKAFHGSPHDFDQFSSAKIGTGEGNQSYLRGLYMAEKPTVGRDYRDMSPVADRASGKPLDTDLRIGGKLVHELYADIERKAARLSNKDAEPLYEQLSGLESLMQHGDFLGVQEAAEAGQVTPRAMEWMKSIEPKFTRKGKLYEVSINADPEDFLDWDAPLSQQSEKVRQKLPAYLQPQEGESMGNSLRRIRIDEDPEESLRAAGIQGIKYLDEGSRGPSLRIGLLKDRIAREKAQGLPFDHWQQELDALEKTQSTRNYVVFDDKLISIVKKYGIAAALSGGLINQAQAAQLKKQGHQ